MADLTLKNVPSELLQRLQSAAKENFRNVNQEVFCRLSRSFDAEEARSSALHARWVHEALASGDATPLKEGELNGAFGRGLTRAKARKQKRAA